MSMITEQVKELDECVKKCQQYPFINVRMNNEGHDFRFIFKNAADTIKTLSEKLQAANMERSTAYYNGGWIPVKERLPEENDYKSCYEVYDGAVFWTNEDGLVGMGYYYESTKRWSDINDCPISVIAWMSLPEPYREDGETA